MQPQPDPRIHKNDLASFTSNGKRFVVNGSPGVPRNACIEEVGGRLRCWASHVWLDDAAAAFVRANAAPTENDSFVWNDGVKVWEVRKG
jgi:hypothetical protein